MAGFVDHMAFTDISLLALKLEYRGRFGTSSDQPRIKPVRGLKDIGKGLGFKNTLRFRGHANRYIVFSAISHKPLESFALGISSVKKKTSTSLW